MVARAMAGNSMRIDLSIVPVVVVVPGLSLEGGGEILLGIVVESLVVIETCIHTGNYRADSSCGFVVMIEGAILADQRIVLGDGDLMEGVLRHGQLDVGIRDRIRRNVAESHRLRAG